MRGRSEGRIGVLPTGRRGVQTGWLAWIRDRIDGSGRVWEWNVALRERERSTQMKWGGGQRA